MYLGIAPAPVTFEVGNLLFSKSPLATQVFFGGLDPSVDRDVLEKLFGSIPNMVSVLMDTDSENHFKVLLFCVWMVLTPGNRSRDVFEPRRCREGDPNIRQSAFGLQWNLDDNACTYDWNRREREQQQQQQQRAVCWSQRAAHGCDGQSEVLTDESFWFNSDPRFGPDFVPNDA